MQTPETSGQARARARKELLDLFGDDFELRRGQPTPLGATPMRGGVNFAVVSGEATSVRLVLFAPGREEPAVELPLDPRYNRTGDVWHAFLRGVDPGFEYGYRAERDPNPEPHLHRFDPQALLVDPYARALSGGEVWGEPPPTPPGTAGFVSRRHWRSRVPRDEFDWGFETPINRHLADSIIYEAHVRSFTAHPSSGVAHPGTYAGLIEKIPYLQELGITALELLPVTEFDETEMVRVNPYTGERLRDLWGYQPIGFFAPKAGYAASVAEGGAVAELKRLVRALHEAGIEVILDMVFNHTGEGDERGRTLSFRGLENPTYYMLDAGGRYLNFSGCGNTLNCNHPRMRSLILESLRYWVTEAHVDGFRFDLASILGRGRDGSVLSDPPLLERIAAEPVLAHTKLIAEAWDAAGLYQVGSFPSFGRWAEWNGRFRDDVRRFVKSDAGMVRLLATRLCGSADLYRGSGRAPYHSVNFITSHDGFTLADLVSYNAKHNTANGEASRDGQDDNQSWNCGEEGEAASPRTRALRARQVKNFATLLLVSQGVPMILAGDEMGRTQLGNNNAYCQDNEISWVDWSLLERNRELFRFFSRLIRFRKAHPSLRRRAFCEDQLGGRTGIAWHGTRCHAPDWTWDSRALALQLCGGGEDDEIYVAMNAHWEGHRFELPPLPSPKTWRVFVDTGRPSPQEIEEPGREAPWPDTTYPLGPRCVAVLVGR